MTSELLTPTTRAAFLKRVNFFGKHTTGNLRNGALFVRAMLEFPGRATTALERMKFRGLPDVSSGR